jgi:hypothetical protein
MAPDTRKDGRAIRRGCRRRSARGAPLANHAGETFAQHRLGGGENDRLHATHPSAPARRRGRSSRSRSPDSFRPRAIVQRAHRAAARPVSSLIAPRATSRSNSPRAPRPDNCPPILEDALKESSSSSAASAAPAPLARRFGWAASSLCAQRPSSAERSQACAAARAWKSSRKRASSSAGANIRIKSRVNMARHDASDRHSDPAPIAAYL